jgi:chemotaxis protein methyltransferase CheR
MNEVVMDTQLFNSFAQLIQEHTGLKLREQDYQPLQHFFLERLQANGCKNFHHYYDVLNSANRPDLTRKPLVNVSPESEWERLINQITTGESYFWRDHGQMKVLSEHLLPELINAKRAAVRQGHSAQLSLRLWSAGCSTGEETYTLAILLQELLPDLPQWQILILGTDLNPLAISRAKQGIYKQWSFRQTPTDFRARYFQTIDNAWQVKPKIRSMPTFRTGNLLQDPFPTLASNCFDIDLILCRNVFIYFPAEIITNILEKFSQTLSPEGYLVCGHSELQAQDLSQFQVLSFPESMVYQRSKQRQPNSAAHQGMLRQSIMPTAPELRSLKNVVSHDPKSRLVIMLPLPPQSQMARIGRAPEVELATTMQVMQAALQQGNYADVIRSAQSLLDKDSQNLEAHLLLAQAYANQGQHVQAVASCQTALQFNAEAFQPLYLLAQIAEEQGDLKQAKILLKKIIYLHPEAVTAYLDLGIIYSHEQKKQQADKMLRSAQLLLQPLEPDTQLEYRGQVTVKMLRQYLEQLLQRTA